MTLLVAVVDGQLVQHQCHSDVELECVREWYFAIMADDDDGWRIQLADPERLVGAIAWTEAGAGYRYPDGTCIACGGKL
jgi:hypothetical protein